MRLMKKCEARERNYKEHILTEIGTINRSYRTKIMSMKEINEDNATRGNAYTKYPLTNTSNTFQINQQQQA